MGPLTAGDEADALALLTPFVSARRRQRIEAVLAERTRMLTVVLEDVYQPHNASAVLRSCECMGVQDVHVVETSNPYEINEDVALGAAKWLNVRRYRELSACLDALRAARYRLVATTPHRADCSLEELEVSGPTAILLGTEEAGLSAQALAAADVRVRLPMYGFTESYNVSVCAALLLRDAVRCLRVSGAAWRLSPSEAQALRLAWYRRSVRSAALVEQRLRQDRQDRQGPPQGCPR